MERNRDGPTYCFVTVWSNDYTSDQLEAGKSVQGGIECVTVCHLDFSNFSLNLCIYIVNFHSKVRLEEPHEYRENVSVM